MKILKVILLVFTFIGTLYARKYVDEKKGVLVDEENKLMWQMNHIQKLNQYEGRIFCEKLNYAGFDDWELPSPHELNNLKSEYLNFDLFPYTVNIGGGRAIYLWSSKDRISYYCVSNEGCDEYHYSEDSDSLNNVICIRKIKDNDLIEDRIENSCSLIEDKPYSRPYYSKWKKRDYETDSEFEASKKRSHDRWVSRINSYKKICNFTAKIIDYDLTSERLKYSYNIQLKGIGKKTVTDKVPVSLATKFLKTLNGTMIFKAVLGMNENEEFYIRKVIYPTSNAREEEKTTLQNIEESNLVSGQLAKPCRVKYTRKNDAIKRIRPGVKISYDRFTKELVYPEKYRKKGAVLIDNPIFEKELSISQSIDNSDPEEPIVTVDVTSNFQIDSIEMKMKNSSFETLALKNRTKKPETKKFLYRASFVVEKGVNYKIRIRGQDFTRVYNCSLKSGCEPIRKVEL
jgi:hypothetical protein